MTSAPKRSPQMPTAVRQTPLTATESPSASSRGERRLDGQAHARRRCESTAATVPRSATSPVNNGLTTPAGGAESRTSSPRPCSQSSVSARSASAIALDALALERVARRAAAEQQRREEEAHLVDLAGVEERAGQVRAALEQDRR